MKVGIRPCRAGDFLDGGLEQHGAVGGANAFVHRDRSLVDAGAGFGVQPFQRDAESLELREHLDQQLRIGRRPQDAVAEHARA